MGSVYLTGNAWVDWPIIGAALLTAYLTLWKKGVKPLVEAAKFILGIRSQLEHLHDCVESVKAGQGALSREFKEHRTEFQLHAEQETAARRQVVAVAETVNAPVVDHPNGGP